MKEFYVTKNGLIAIRDKLHELTQEIKECNRKIGITVDLDNDLRENPEFMALRTKVEYELPNRIGELNEVISKHILIESLPHIVNNETECVGIGHKVLLLDESDNRRVIHILGYDESNPKKNIVSYLTPLAKKLMDLSVDDEVILISEGKEFIYCISDISTSDYLK